MFMKIKGYFCVVAVIVEPHKVNSGFLLILKMVIFKKWKFKKMRCYNFVNGRVAVAFYEFFHE